MRVQCKLLFGEKRSHITTFQADQSQLVSQSPAPATEHHGQVKTLRRLSAKGVDSVLVIPTVTYCLHV